MTPITPRSSGRRSVAPILLLALAVSLPLSPGQEARAQLVTGRLSTSVYSWEKYDTVNVKNHYLRAFQTVQISVAQENVSLHTYFTGAATTSGDDAAARFYSLYLRWADIGKTLDLNLGRQAVYAGVGTGTIDGLSARIHLWNDRVTVTGFGGATPDVGFRGIEKNFHENLSVGGQVVTTVLQGARIGVSYLHRNEERDPYWTLRARDTTYAAVPYYVSFEPDAEELLGGDFYYTHGTLFSVYGRYDHDLEMGHVSRALGGFRLALTSRLALTGEYQHRLPRVSYNSIFSAFVQNAVNEAEGGIEYECAPLVRAFARVASISYTDETSARWTVGLNAKYGTIVYSASNGYAGELQSVTAQGAYPVAQGILIPCAGLSYASYRLEEGDARSNAWSFLLGATFRPTSVFSLDLQGQWLANKIYARDLRGFLKLNYWFRERLGLFGQEVK